MSLNRDEYRSAFDELSFSADFQERTAELLRTRARELEKERTEMMFAKPKKMAVLIAACIALLAVSVSAAVLLMTPAQVAEEHNQPLLAEAFQGPDAILIDETVESGDYAITLMGLVSGRNLDVLNQDLEADHTYSVLALRRLDGTALTNQDFDFISYTMTPLAAGCSPTAVNNWTLGAGASGLARDGVFYYLLDTQSIEMFADRTVRPCSPCPWIPPRRTQQRQRPSWLRTPWAGPTSAAPRKRIGTLSATRRRTARRSSSGPQAGTAETHNPG